MKRKMNCEICGSENGGVIKSLFKRLLVPVSTYGMFPNICTTCMSKIEGHIRTEGRILESIPVTYRYAHHNEEVFVGGLYRHFKGKLYLVIAISKHTETGELLVVYKEDNAGVDSQIYSRPIDMFLENVDKKKYPDVAQEKRFRYMWTLL